MRRLKRWRISFRKPPGRLAVVLALLYLLTSSSIHLFHSGHGCGHATPCATCHGDHDSHPPGHPRHDGRDHEKHPVQLAAWPATVHTAGHGPCPACLFAKTNHIPRLLELGTRQVVLARVAWTPEAPRALPDSLRIVPHQPRAPPAA